MRVSVSPRDCGLGCWKMAATVRGTRSHSKFWAPERSHEASSILRAHKFLGATVQIVVATVTWRPGLVHRLIKLSWKIMTEEIAAAYLKVLRGAPGMTEEDSGSCCQVGLQNVSHR